MHPKGVSPLSSGENTNSYKELLKMKKILSILLAMVMIVSSITVAFVTIAAAPIEENVEKINTQTAYIADAKNAEDDYYEQNNNAETVNIYDEHTWY